MADPLADLKGNIPIALFPVRLETRFVPRLGGIGGTDLLIRVYPTSITIVTSPT